MRRRAKHVAGAILFLCCAVVSYLVTLAVMAEPTPVRDTSAVRNEILARALPEGEDATALLIEALDRAAAAAEGQFRMSNLITLRQGEWDDPRLEDAQRSWDILQADATPLLHEAARRDMILDPYIFTDGDVTTEIQRRMRSFTFLRLAPVVGLRQAAEEKDWQALNQWMETGLGIARMLHEHPNLTHMLSGRSLRATMMYEIRTIAIEGNLTPGVIERLIPLVHEGVLEVRNVRLVGELYVLSEQRWLDRRFSRSGLAVLWMLEARPSAAVWRRLEESPPLRGQLWNVRALVLPRREVVERAIHDRVAATIEWWESGPANPRARPARGVELRVPDDWRLGSIGGTMHGVLRHSLQDETERLGTVLMLRLVAHHAARGRWPESLAEVATEEEMIDPLTGAPFEYELTPDDPDGAPFRLATASPPGTGWGEWLFSHPREDLDPPMEEVEW